MLYLLKHQKQVKSNCSKINSTLPQKLKQENECYVSRRLIGLYRALVNWINLRLLMWCSLPLNSEFSRFPREVLFQQLSVRSLQCVGSVHFITEFACIKNSDCNLSRTLTNWTCSNDCSRTLETRFLYIML